MQGIRIPATIGDGHFLQVLSQNFLCTLRKLLQVLIITLRLQQIRQVFSLHLQQRPKSSVTHRLLFRHLRPPEHSLRSPQARISASALRHHRGTGDDPVLTLWSRWYCTGLDNVLSIAIALAACVPMRTAPAWCPAGRARASWQDAVRSPIRAARPAVARLTGNRQQGEHEQAPGRRRGRRIHLTSRMTDNVTKLPYAYDRSGRNRQQAGSREAHVSAELIAIATSISSAASSPSGSPT